jgi:CheY-like chemotaxis protein
MEKRRILVVDDEADFTSLLKLNLEKTGAYEVREEHCGEHALAAARAFKPDLILLDVMMPHIDGGQVAAQLKADRRLKDTPIVFLTAVVSKEEAKGQKGMIGGHRFITKPVTPEEVMASIEEYLPSQKRQHAMPKKRILVIDDEEDFSALLKLNIERTTEYEVLLADSGEAGLELIDMHEPDLVLLDIMMPGMDGVETLRRIKASAPDLPVAMVTAVYKEEEAKRCFDAGAFEYIAKPVDFEYVKTALLVKLF